MVVVVFSVCRVMHVVWSKLFEVLLVFHKERDVGGSNLSLVWPLCLKHVEGTVAQQSSPRNPSEVVLVEVYGVLMSPEPG